jgi:nucleotide-binding universal stress UspA family protein
MRTLVVPLDGSERAESAVWLAQEVALANGDAVCLVRVSAPNETQAAIAYLESVANRVQGVPISVEVVAIEPGEKVAEGISQAVEAAGPDVLLCLAVQGHGALSTKLLGSTTEDLMRDFDGPILVAPIPRLG